MHIYYTELYLGNTYSLILILRLHAQYFFNLNSKGKEKSNFKKAVISVSKE